MKGIIAVVLSFVILLSVSAIPQYVAPGALPANFSWGASSASYQIEGAWNESGKGLNWWDWWYLLDNTPIDLTGDNADEFYYRFEKDVALMKTIGLKNFRMSISWPRVLPNGTVDSPNDSGVEFYKRVFKALTDAGIEPWVTLYHNDFPQALSPANSTGSWLNPDIARLFGEYADFCFHHFGDLVKNWITLNEPMIEAWNAYGAGYQPPFRCTSDVYNPNCTSVGGGGNSSTEPYIAGKNFILAHATAVKIYRDKYKPTQNGQIGWTLNINYVLPWNASDAKDIEAVDTYIQFTLGWFANPVINGDYPEIMKQYITGDRLPLFTKEEKALINGSLDFLGINHYTTWYIHYTGIVGTDYNSDSRTVVNYTDADGKAIGIVAESGWLFNYPPGMKLILNWCKTEYNNFPIVILENGWDTLNESSFSIPKAIADYQRITVINAYIDNLVSAVVDDGVDVRGYFVWAWMDNFEWGSYVPRFGLVYVDYDHNYTRYPKASSYWYIEKQNHINAWALGEREYPYYDYNEEGMIDLISN